MAYDIKQFRAALKAYLHSKSFYTLDEYLISIILVSYDFIIGSHGYVNMLKICTVYYVYIVNTV
jgi:hypothetical protein